MVQHEDIDHTGITGIGDALVMVRKASAEIVNGSATVQNDNELFLALAANEVWEFTLFLWYDSGTTPDIKATFTVPSGATLEWTHQGVDAAGSAQTENATFAATTERNFFGNGVGSTRFIRITGIVVNGATPGNLQFQWAQNTSNGSNTTVHANSTLKAYKLAP